MPSKITEKDQTVGYHEKSIPGKTQGQVVPKGLYSEERMSDYDFLSPFLKNQMHSTRSPNCSAPDAKPTTLYTYTASSSLHPDHVHTSYMTSCQLDNREIPDQVTHKAIQTVAATHIEAHTGSKVGVTTISVEPVSIALGSQSIEGQHPNLIKRRMASNCAAEGYDMSKITSYNQYVCQYTGTGKDDKGRTVRNPFQRWKGTLASASPISKCRSRQPRTFESSCGTPLEVRRLS